MHSEGNDHVVPLDQAAIEVLAELDQHERNAQAIIGYFIRQRKLTGQWAIAANRRELVRVETGEHGESPTA